MANDIEDFEEHRRRYAAKKKRHEFAELHKSFVEANKDEWAIEAFADCFVEVLREVNRIVGAGCGAGELTRFFELLQRGAKVHPCTLTQTALARIKPSAERYFGDDKEKHREQALLDIARAGLALLVENGATDQNARGRKDQREYKLRMAIHEYVEKYEMVARQQPSEAFGSTATKLAMSTSLYDGLSTTTLRKDMEPRENDQTSNSAEWKPQAYSPKTLAAEWGCSTTHVRSLIKRGELRGVLLRGKLYRIRVEDAREYERRTKL
jgi:excisionase family DNA binding protein